MDVSYIASLANLTVSDEEKSKRQLEFDATLKEIELIGSMDTTNITETSQVTGTKNVFRDDIVDKTNILDQKQVLSQSKKSFNGYIVVPNVFE